MAPASSNLYGQRSNPFALVFVVVFLTIVVSALGYYFLGIVEDEPWDLLNCIYFTVISLTTAGYGETLPDFEYDVPARVYTIFVLIIGYTVMVWAASTITAVLVEGRFSERMLMRKMMRKIDDLTAHYILVGVGETGIHALEELQRTLREVVVVELDRDRLATAQRYGPCLFIEGDAEDEATLLAAGIGRAAGLIACLPEDKDNIYVVLTARQLNPDLRIVARAQSEESRDKLLRAGADTVVSPNSIGGLRIASEMVRPSVTGFLDLMLRDKDHTIRVEEAVVAEGSGLAGRTLAEADIHRQANLLVVAIRASGDATFVYNPGPDTRLEPGMVLIVIGRAEDAHRLRQIASAG